MVAAFRHCPIYSAAATKINLRRAMWSNGGVEVFVGYVDRLVNFDNYHMRKSLICCLMKILSEILLKYGINFSGQLRHL